MKPFLVIVLLAAFVSPVLAQDQGQQPAPRPMQKDPRAATAFALGLPGTGHIYAGETGTGLVLLGIGTLAPTIGFIIDRVSDVDDGTAITIGSVAAAASWVYSLVDAGKAARRANRRNGYAVAVAPSVLQDRPALAVRVRW